MTEIHWIKLSTDLFDNRKIKYLRRLPEGDSLVLIWVALLTLGGRCNAGGRIFFTENIPYTPKMLANELDVEESALLFALDTFESIEMISRTEDGSIYISGWEEHQSTDALEQIREQNRLRKRKQRERQNSLSASRDSEATFCDSHAIDIEEDTDKDTEKEKEEYEEKAPAEKAGVKKTKQFVPPTLNEVKDYCLQRKSQVDPVRFWEYFDTGGWKDSGGKPVRNWKQKLLTWESHHEEKGGMKNDSTADHPDVVSEWNIRYTVDGRTL